MPPSVGSAGNPHPHLGEEAQCEQLLALCCCSCILLSLDRQELHLFVLLLPISLLLLLPIVDQNLGSCERVSARVRGALTNRNNNLNKADLATTKPLP